MGKTHASRVRYGASHSLAEVVRLRCVAFNHALDPNFHEFGYGIARGERLRLGVSLQLGEEVQRGGRVNVAITLRDRIAERAGDVVGGLRGERAIGVG